MEDKSKVVEAAPAKKEVMVTCVATKSFILRKDDHSELKIEAGVQELPDWVPEHWYAKVNGLKVYDGRKLTDEEKTTLANAKKTPAELKAEQLEAQMGELVDGKVKDVIEALPALSDDELAALLALETAGKARVSLVEAIKAEQASDARKK